MLAILKGHALPTLIVNLWNRVRLIFAFFYSMSTKFLFLRQPICLPRVILESMCVFACEFGRMSALCEHEYIVLLWAHLRVGNILISCNFATSISLLNNIKRFGIQKDGNK